MFFSSPSALFLKNLALHGHVAAFWNYLTWKDITVAQNELYAQT
jgi:hypothetical protein